MGVNDSIRAYNGVISWINNNNFDLGKPERKTNRGIDEHLNEIWRRFGKEHDIPMEKNNSKKYKGSYNPQMANCQNIQEHWDKFVPWVKSNFKTK